MTIAGAKEESDWACKATGQIKELVEDTHCDNDSRSTTWSAEEGRQISRGVAAEGEELPSLDSHSAGWYVSRTSP